MLEIKKSAGEDYIGRDVYFIIEGKDDPNAIGGFIVSHAHRIIDTCHHGFWTGDETHFPNNADLSSWDELGDVAFLDERRAYDKVLESYISGLKEGMKFWAEDVCGYEMFCNVTDNSYEDVRNPDSVIYPCGLVYDMKSRVVCIHDRDLFDSLQVVEYKKEDL